MTKEQLEKLQKENKEVSQTLAGISSAPPGEQTDMDKARALYSKMLPWGK